MRSGIDLVKETRKQLIWRRRSWMEQIKVKDVAADASRQSFTLTFKIKFRSYENTMTRHFNELRSLLKEISLQK